MPVSLQNLFNHIRLLFCGISDTSNNFFSKRILPLHVCSIFTGQVLVLAFSKVAKIEGKVFVALRAYHGDRSLKGDYFAPVAL